MSIHVNIEGRHINLKVFVHSERKQYHLLSYTLWCNKIRIDHR